MSVKHGTNRFFPRAGLGSGSGGTAAPTKDDKNLAPLATVGNFAPTGITISNTPAGQRYVAVFVNGVHYEVGDGVKTLDCYFSSDGGVTARLFASLVAGDQLIWNSITAGFALAATDRVNLDYDIVT